MSSSYTAQVGPDNAAVLSALPGTGPAAPVEDIGEGSVQVNDLDWLRTLGPDEDGHITDDADEGLQIWVGGDCYPLFDAAGQAIADALGAQTEFDEAQRNADRFRRSFAQALATAVDATGSVAATADQSGIAEDTITALLTEIGALPAAESTAAEPTAAESAGVDGTDVDTDSTSGTADADTDIEAGAEGATSMS